MAVAIRFWSNLATDLHPRGRARCLGLSVFVLRDGAKALECLTMSKNNHGRTVRSHFGSSSQTMALALIVSHKPVLDTLEDVAALCVLLLV